MTRTDISVRHFQTGDERIFRKMNEDWIRRYFVLETKDEASFADPQTSILRRGGRILFAVMNEEVVGCCALVAMGPGEFEVAKMAVAESSQRAGVGRYLLEQTIRAAHELGASRLYLETNKILTPAIRLYESVGFQHLAPERVVPSPYARANVFMEMLL